MGAAGVLEFKAKSVEMMRLCEVFLATIVEHVHGVQENGPESAAACQDLQQVGPRYGDQHCTRA